MITEHKRLLLREYLRASKDRHGRQRSVGDQHDDNVREVTDHGWSLGEPYQDNDRSASRYAKKAREDFGQLLADLRADQFAADALLLWESSRGSRKVGEWVTLLDLCEERRVLIYVTTHRRLYDPANPRDRKTLLEDAVDSEYESAKTNLRMMRDTASAARAGRPHGAAGFGYRRTYDPATGKFKAQEKHPEEAALVRELFRRFVKGHSLAAIAADWAARGIRNDSGKPYHPAHLRVLLVTPAYAGLRIHDPSGKLGRSAATQAQASLVKATWPKIVPLSKFLAARDILADPARRDSRPGRAKHPLSMIGRCDVCSGPISARFPPDWPEGGIYRCRTGHVRIGKPALDAYVEEVILGWYASGAVYKAQRFLAGDREDLAAAREDVAVVRAELKDLARQVGSGALTATLAADAEPEMRRRLAEAERREAELSMPSRLAELLPPGPDVAERWADSPMSARREVAQLLLSPDLLGELRVRRAEFRGQPVEDRVVFRRDQLLE